MNHKLLLAFATAALAAGVSIPGMVIGQTASPATTGGATVAGSPDEASPLLLRNRKMAEIMRDMMQEMSRMQEQMAKGDMTAVPHKQMSQRMKQMSTMMRRMSGLLDRPAMKCKDDPEINKRMQEMRSQMDKMMRDSSTASPAK